MIENLSSAELIHDLTVAITQSIVFVTALYGLKTVKRNSQIKKFKKTFDIDHIEIPPELKQVTIPKHLDIAERNPNVAYFVKTVREKIPEAYLKNFYYKLNYLTIEKNKFIYFWGYDGYYIPSQNSITLGKNDSIYHELFHVISTSPDFRFNGFSFEINGRNVGDGLNEGYTELLARRYFGDRIKDKQSYNIELGMCQQLEKIVGSDRMTELYLNANLHGLINELKKYSSEEEVIEFIRNIDFIHKFHSKSSSLFRNRQIQKAVKRADVYLVKTHMRFLQAKLTDGKITEENYYKEHKDFVESLHKKTETSPKYKGFERNDLYDAYDELNREQKRK